MSAAVATEVVESASELVELYNPADIFAWLIEAARDAPGHLVPADELAHEEELVEEVIKVFLRQQRRGKAPTVAEPARAAA